MAMQLNDKGDTFTLSFEFSKEDFRIVELRVCNLFLLIKTGNDLPIKKVKKLLALQKKDPKPDYPKKYKKVEAYTKETVKYFENKNFDFRFEEEIESPEDAFCFPIIRNNRIIEHTVTQLNEKQKRLSFTLTCMVKGLFHELLVDQKNKKFLRDKKACACFIYEGISNYILPWKGAKGYKPYKRAVVTGFIMSRLGFFQTAEAFDNSKRKYRDYHEYLFQILKGDLKKYVKHY